MKTIVAHNRSIFGLGIMFELFLFQVFPMQKLICGFYIFKTKICAIDREFSTHSPSL